MPVERVLPHGSAHLLTVANNRATGFGYARRWRNGWTPIGGVEAVSQRMEHDGLVTGAAWSPDGGRVLTIGDDGIARVWWTAPTAAIGERQASLEADEAAANQKSDGEQANARSSDIVLAAAVERQIVTEHDTAAHRITVPAGLSLDSAKLPQTLASELAKVPAAPEANRTRFLIFVGVKPYRAFRSPDGRWLLTSKCGDERAAAEAVLWDFATAQRTGGLSTELPIQDICFAHNAARFAVASGFNMSGSVRVYRTPDAQPIAPAFKGPGKPFQLSLSPDGARLAVGFAIDPMENGSEVGIFDVEESLSLIEARFFAFGAETMRFVADGQRFVAGGQRFAAARLASREQIWDTPAPTESAPEWLPELARIVAHRELDAASAVQHIRNVASRREALRLKVQSSPNSAARTIALAALAKPAERLVSPFARQTYRERMEQEIGEWKQRANETMHGSAESEALVPETLALLEDASDLSHRAFGDAGLLASLETPSATLRNQLLTLLSARVAEMGKRADPDKALMTSQDLQKLRELAIMDAGSLDQIRALQERLAASRLANGNAQESDKTQ